MTAMTAIVLADSELSTVRVATGQVEMRFAAMRVAEPPMPFERAAEHYLPGVVMQLQGQVQAGHPQQAVGRVATAVLTVQGRRLDRLAVPCQAEGPLTLELHLGNGAQLQLQASHLALWQPDGPRMVERLSC